MTGQERDVAKIMGGVALVALCFDAAADAWGERRFVAAFAEAFAANGLYWGAMAAGLYAGYRAADKVYRLFKQRYFALAIAVFFVVLAAVTAGIWEAARNIPGVGWRIEAIANRDRDCEWDYRSGGCF